MATIIAEIRLVMKKDRGALLLVTNYGIIVILRSARSPPRNGWLFRLYDNSNTW